MPRAIDLSTVSPEYADQLLKARARKRSEYLRRKEILLQRAKDWRAANPDKERAIAKQWVESNRERKANITRENYERHRTKYLANSTAAQKQLADSVIKSWFCSGTGLQSKDVPAELIPVIRLSIQIKRELKAKRNLK